MPVVYEFGNYELYGHDFDEVVDRLRDAASGTSVHFLERNRVDIAGVRFLGCCLWTDYELALAPNASKSLAMITAAHTIYDHTAIRRRGERFTPQMALDEHRLARSWLTNSPKGSMVQLWW